MILPESYKNKTKIDIELKVQTIIGLLLFLKNFNIYTNK